MAFSRPARITAAVLGLTVVALLFAGPLAWRVTGGRWFVVKTPSMGQAAPVGTLLLTRPVALADVHVGDVITFHSPVSGEIYSHRVAARTALGLTTRGDINGVADPWVVTGKDLVGRVTMRWWGCGWLLRGVPLVLLGMAVVVLLTALVRRPLRAPLRLVGASLVVTLVAAWLRPWVGLEKLGATTVGDHVGVRAVSTGVLPIRVADSRGGEWVHFASGQAAVIPVSHRTAGGAFSVSSALSLSLWWWVAIVLVCLLPLLGTVIFGFAAPYPPPADDVLADEQPVEPGPVGAPA